MSNLYTGGPFKQRDGTAITRVSTDVNGGSIKSASTNSDVVRTSHWSQGRNLNPSIKAGVAGAGQADWNTFAQAVYTGGVSGAGALTGVTQAAGNYTGLIRLNHGSHGFNSGAAIHLKYNPANSTGAYNGIYRVLSIVDTNSVVLNGLYVNNITGILYSTPIGTIANQEAGNYTIRKINGRVHGVANTKVQTGASDFGRSKVYKVLAVRTRKIATAIRAGYWNPFTGQFSTDPTFANDYTSFDVDGTNIPDDETKDTTTKYGIGGEFAYNAGGRTTVSGNYDAKTG